MDALREHLLILLSGHGAHAPFEDAVHDFPVALRSAKPDGAPHNAWQLLEHLRFTQHDLLDYSRNPDYQEPKWPEAYWPDTDTPSSPDAWDQSIAAFQGDLKAFRSLVEDESIDLLAPIPHKPLLRNALILADHNSYHLGQLIYLRKTICPA